MRKTMSVVTLTVLISTALAICQGREIQPLSTKFDAFDELLRAFAAAAANLDTQKAEHLFLPADDTLAGKKRAANIREMRKDWKRAKDSGEKGIPIRFEKTKKVIRSRMIVETEKGKEQTCDVEFTVVFTDEGWKIASMETNPSRSSKRMARTSILGTVTVDGKPLQSGRIVFKPVDVLGPISGGKIKNGAFSISREEGPYPGKHRVEIISLKKTGRKVVDSRSNQQVDEYIQVIPPRYNSKSELTCTLTNAKNTLNFNLLLK